MERPLRSPNHTNVRTSTMSVMKRIRDVINETATPSWVNLVPSNFGDSSAGTLKADEWRTIITIYLPIALISLWATEYSQGPHSVQLRSILDHTMHLVSAISVVSQRTMTVARAEAYQRYMVSYIRDLQKLFPDVGFRPNHHMAIHIHNFMLHMDPLTPGGAFPSNVSLASSSECHTTINSVSTSSSPQLRSF